MLRDNVINLIYRIGLEEPRNLLNIIILNMENISYFKRLKCLKLSSLYINNMIGNIRSYLLYQNFTCHS